MKKILKIILKYIFLFLVGGFVYYSIEIAYRGYSHWTMILLGGICFIALGNINNILSWSTPLIAQSLIGATIITILEYITGLIVNIKLGWNVWDYSDVPLNIQGQICLPFFMVWIFVAAVGIILDDYLRYWLFKEKKPKYDIV